MTIKEMDMGNLDNQLMGNLDNQLVHMSILVYFYLLRNINYDNSFLSNTS